MANDNVDELVTSGNNEPMYDCDHCEIDQHTENGFRAHGETSHNCQECDSENENTRFQQIHRKERSACINKDVNEAWLDEIIRKYENI